MKQGAGFRGGMSVWAKGTREPKGGEKAGGGLERGAGAAFAGALSADSPPSRKGGLILFAVCMFDISQVG